jgi:2-polyprenyl-3-methyl-5-hydroxy-6-metoxy-1,4-benzoquinol methylase
MDDPGIDPVAHRRALAGLARLNALSGSTGVLWGPIRTYAAKHPGRPLRVLDVACGSGDVPVGLARRASRAGVNLQIDACDLSATAIQASEEAARAAGVGERVRVFAHDAIRDPLPDGYDVVTCSLFLHHLTDDDAVTVLRRMRDASTGLVLVNDLARSWFNYLAVWLVCRVVTRSPVVHFDGPASVRSAFTPTEALTLAQRAGLDGATVASRWPCRFLLRWSRPEAGVGKPESP